MSLITAEYGRGHQQEKRLWKEIKSGFTHFANNDVVIAKITPCYENGKSTVIKDLYNEFGAGTTELHVFRGNIKLLLPEDVLINFKSPIFLKKGEENMTGTAGQKRIPRDFILSNPFPLPPLNEQKRIVAKVDELMNNLDEMGKEVKASRENAGNLYKAFMKELFEF